MSTKRNHKVITSGTKPPEQPAHKFRQEDISKLEPTIVTKDSPEKDRDQALEHCIEMLRRAIRDWTRADLAYSHLSGIQDGSRPLPVLEFTSTHEDKPVKLAIDLAEIDAVDIPTVADILLGPTMQKYEQHLLQISKASTTAVELLRKYNKS